MRILITGPECTGKSTLAKELSEHLQIPWFPEHARTYLEKHGKAYKQKDIAQIAKEHFQLVNVFPQSQQLIFDTYLLNLKLWSEIKYDKPIPWIDEQLLELKKFDFVFLLNPDLPWTQDGYRENKTNLHMLFSKFESALNDLAWDYHVVTGLGAHRTQSAIDIISMQ